MTYKDVIGNWEVQDSVINQYVAKSYFRFSDTSHINWMMDNMAMPIMFYKIENEADSSAIRINGTGDYSSYHSGEVHRIILNKDTLKIYNFYFPLVSGYHPQYLKLVRSKSQ